MFRNNFKMIPLIKRSFKMYQNQGYVNELNKKLSEARMSNINRRTMAPSEQQLYS